MMIAFCCVFEGAAFAQGMFVASIGKVYGGDAQTSSGAYAIAIGGGGAHSIGSELATVSGDAATGLTATFRVAVAV